MRRHGYARTALLLGTSVLTAATFDPAVVKAQEAETQVSEDSGAGLEEIVVTARKRSESLSSVPVSVSAISGDKLDNIGASNVADMVQIVPAVKIVSQALGSSAFIRGTGSGSFNPGFEQTVGFFTDGAYFSRGAWNRQGQLDIERVEVLKGPQGVLFGKNTVAGAINIISRNPTDRFEAMARVGYEFEASDEVIAEGFVSGPLDQDGKLKARLAVKYSDQSKGYVENLSPLGRDGPITDQFLGRATLVWEPTDNIQNNTKLTYIHSRTHGTNIEVFRCGAISPPTPLDAPSLNMARFFGATAEDCQANYKNALVTLDAGTAALLSQQTGRTIDPVEPGEKFEGFAAINTLNIRLGDNQLTSVSGYIDHKQNIVTELDNSDVPFSSFARTENFESFTQELRLASPQEDRFTWVFGAYYEHNRLKFDDYASIHMTSYPGFPPSGPLPPSGTFSKAVDQKGTSWALFGELSYDLTPTLELSAGLRYSNEKKNVDHRICVGLLDNPTCNNTADDTPAITPLIAEQLTYVDKFSDDNLSPAVTLRWKPNADAMFYASFKKGFKSGGFDFETRALPAGLSAGPPTRIDSDGDGIPDSFKFQSEKVTSYELGTKLTLANGNLQVAMALFQNDFKNLQTSQFDGVVGFNTINAGRARSRGLEIDARFRAAPGLIFTGTMSVLDSKFLDFPGAQCPSDSTPADITGTTPTGAPSCNLKGKRTAFAPQVAFTVSGDYVHRINDSLRLALNANVQRSGKYFLENTGEPQNMQNAFWKLGGRIAIESDHWDLALIGRNLTNSITYSHGTSVPLSGPGYYMGFIEQPRTLMVQATVRY